jgi:ATP-dependent DNA helicase RecG
MFSEDPQKYFRYATIEVVDIPDPTGNGMTEKIFTGPIQRQLKDALAYIKNYILKEAVIKIPDKAEASRAFNYPFAAVEEILSNAVYHRSYQINEPITVRVTKTCMEITSFPGFDRSITDENIKNYDIRARWYRNRRIGDFLKELKLIEGRNTGFPTALKALRENGSAYPKFEMDENRDYLSVIIPVHPYFAPSENKEAGKEAYMEKVMAALREKPLMLTELAAALGYKGISKKLSTTVENMIATGKLKRITDNKQIKISIT